MKTPILFLILLNFCPLWASELQRTAVYISDEIPTNILPSTFDASLLCAACSAHICEQCIEKNQTQQSIVSYTIEEQRRAIAAQRKTIEQQNAKLASLECQLKTAIMLHETMALQRHVIDLQLHQISDLQNKLQAYASNQQEIEQLRDTVADFRELFVPLQKENENRFNLMTKRSAALKELAEKKIPVQHALLATLAEMGRGRRDAIWHHIGQPQHFVSKTLPPLSQETKEALKEDLKAWFS